MSSHWFSLVALIAAVLLGYAVVNQRGQDDMHIIAPAPVLMGSYIKDAVIDETDASGAQYLRLTAANATQDPRDDSVTMHTVRIDFATHEKSTAASQKMPGVWVINADRAYRAARSDIVNLSSNNQTSNVVARSVSSKQSVVLTAASLDVDLKKQGASSNDVAQIELGAYSTTGRGLSIDLPREHLALRDGNLRLAATQRADVQPSAAFSLPTTFKYKSLDGDGNTVRMTEVETLTEPFVRADEAVSAGTDTINNQFTLRGNVVFDLPAQGKLRADSAVITIRDGRVSYATAAGKQDDQSLDGKWVEFEHQLKSKDQTTAVGRGRAKSIDYDVAAQMLFLKGDVWFSNGRVEQKSDEFEYNLLTGAFSDGKSQRSRATIHPRDPSSSPTPAPKPKP